MKTAAVCALLAALTLPACSNSGDSSKNMASQNPVTILQKISGCELPPGAVSGDKDAFGDRMASCQIANPSDASSSATEDVTIYTNSDSSTLKDNLTQITSDDENQRIDGPNFVISVTGVTNLDTGGTDYYTDASTIATQVGGTVAPPS